MAEDQVKETQDTQDSVDMDTSQQEVDNSQDTASEDTAVKEKKGVLDRIKDLMSGSKDDDTDTSEEQSTAEVPDKFNTLVKDLGWEKEDVDQLLEGRSTEEIEELIPHLEEMLNGGDEDSDDSDTEESDAGATLDHDEESSKAESGKEENAETKALLERIEKLEQQLEGRKKDQDKEDLVALGNKIDSIFDGYAKDLPVFGSTEKLPKFPNGKIDPTSEAFKARQEVWEVAYALMAAGQGPEKSMDLALKAYKGNHPEHVEKKIVTDLKSHETRVTPKRESRNLQDIAPPGSRDYKRQVVQEAMKKAGME